MAVPASDHWSCLQNKIHYNKYQPVDSMVVLPPFNASLHESNAFLHQSNAFKPMTGSWQMHTLAEGWRIGMQPQSPFLGSCPSLPLIGHYRD